MSQAHDKRRSRAGTQALLVVFGLLLIAGPAAAQQRSYYFKERTFEIPFDMNFGRPVAKVLLHVSTDRQRYNQVASAEPSAGRFAYTARSDGWYHFVVQVQDQAGVYTPAEVGRAGPDLSVFVDTKPPEVHLKPVQPRQGTVAVEWKISDDTLDINTLRLEYAAVGTRAWTVLNVKPINPAQFSWTPPAAGDYDVRLTVADKAGNTTTQTTQVKALTAGGPAGGSADVAGGAKVIHVRGKSFQLNYSIDQSSTGRSGVKKVEVWRTTDTRQWTIINHEAPPNGPLTVTVERTGRYGFTLRPFSGVGRAPRAPDPGEQPQLWVQVDEKAPVVRLQGLPTVGEGPDAGTITVRWSASDDHLADQPITILYSEKKDGPFTPLKEKVENSGSCKCPTKDLPFEFYVRVEAVDRAGNKGHDQSAETVKVDLSVPVINHVTAVHVDAAPANK